MVPEPEDGLDLHQRVPFPKELRQAIEKYVQDYNTVRPHQSLDNATPEAIYQACFQIGA